MDDQMREILAQLAEGETEAGFSRTGAATVDTTRADRTQIPEAVLGDHKTTEDLVEIAQEHLDQTGRAILTRLDEDAREELEGLADDSEWYSNARILILRSPSFEPPEVNGQVGIVTAGTADLPAAEEALVTAREVGCEIETLYDVGVAGIHRFIAGMEQVEDSDCIIVAAGRGGDLAPTAAGLLRPPVIGLPVSVGYGQGGGGEASLQGMLQSAAVMSVVNIDAGFIAGAQAAKIARR